MLTSFTFENFKCYRDETTLALDAVGIKEHESSLIEGFGGRSHLPIAVLYGPNGGGKSSVIQAFGCLRSFIVTPWLVMRSVRVRGRFRKWRPFVYDDESRGAPTTFRVLFEAKGYQYRYVLSLRGDEVAEEYLHRRGVGPGAGTMLFERCDGSIAYGASLKREGVSSRVDAKMPVLTFLAINYDIGSIDTAFDWFMGSSILDYTIPDFENTFSGVEDELVKLRTVRLLNSMDIDVSDIRYVVGDDDGGIDEIYLTHTSNAEVELELMEESNGTKKLLSLAPRVIAALDTGSLVLSDELDAKLHPKLLRFLIRLFTNKKSNPLGAQLIFTSHDMSTLNSSVFRRDEIWFAAKGNDGSSSLYSLADIADVGGARVRTQNAYDRQYLEGRYGADPYLRAMTEWSLDHVQ